MYLHHFNTKKNIRKICKKKIIEKYIITLNNKDVKFYCGDPHG